MAFAQVSKPSGSNFRINLLTKTIEGFRSYLSCLNYDIRHVNKWISDRNLRSN